MSLTSSCRAPLRRSPSRSHLLLLLLLLLEAEHRQLQPALLVDALRAGAAVHAQLQVLCLVERHSQFLGHAHGQRQVAAQLPHHHSHADVRGVHLYVTAGRFLQHQQTAHLAGAADYRTVHEGCWKIIRHRLVHLLIRALLIRLEYYCDLQEEHRDRRKS
uniref:Secreted protein n=1 Tax=Astyanax mexicanus TaxID=7994 RepID=A0A3B1IK81_ASTMX